MTVKQSSGQGSLEYSIEQTVDAADRVGCIARVPEPRDERLHVSSVEIAHTYVTQPKATAKVERAQPEGEMLAVRTARSLAPPESHGVCPKPVGGERAERGFRIDEWV